LHNQRFTPITYIETTDENLVQLDFEDWFNVIPNARKKEQYAQVTYPELTNFLYSWSDLKNNGATSC
jgi:hypothetical protein